MIRTFVGLPGAGKTMYFSYLIGTEIERIKVGRSKYDIVAVNFDWNNGKGDYARYDYTEKRWYCGGLILAFDDLPELYEVKNCLVFVDEAGYLLNSLDWDKMPADYKYFLFQHRKNITDLSKRFDMNIATQHKEIVEITLRRVTNNIYLLRPLFQHKNPDRPPRLFIPVVKISYYKEHELLQHPKRLQPDEKLKEDDELESLHLIHVYWIGKKYRSYYNTLQKVQKQERKKGS